MRLVAIRRLMCRVRLELKRVHAEHAYIICVCRFVIKIISSRYQTIGTKILKRINGRRLLKRRVDQSNVPFE